MKYITSNLTRKIVLSVMAFMLISVGVMTWIIYHFLSTSEKDKLVATHQAMMLSIDLYRDDIVGLIEDAKDLKPDEVENYVNTNEHVATMFNMLSKLGEDEYIGRPYLLYPDVVTVNGEPATKMLAVNDQLRELGSEFQSDFILPDIFVTAMNEVSKAGNTDVISTPPYNDGDGDWMSTLSKITDSEGNYIADFGIDFKYSVVEERLQQVLLLSLGAGLLISLIGAIVLWLLIKTQLSPLKVITESITKASDGDFTHKVDTNRKDELGHVAEHFNKMLDDLSILITKIKDDADSVLTASKEVFEASTVLVASSEQVKASMEEVATGSNSQLQSLSETGNSLEEVAGSSHVIAVASASLLESASTAEKEAIDIKGFMDNAVSSMSKVKNSSEESEHGLNQVISASANITGILGVIQEISRQTNLLALNASIEAARAGEYGRGFAVVASEIRKLAEQSNSSAKEIGDIVGDVNSSVSNLKQISEVSALNVEEGINVIGKVSHSVDNIVVQIQDVTMQVQEVSSSTQQLSATTQEISATVEQLRALSKSSAEHAKESLNASVEQVGESSNLISISDNLVNSANSVLDAVKSFKL